jgi:uncharacterized membrane protein
MTALVEVYSPQALSEEQQQQIHNQILQHLIIETNRSFLQDPRFCLLVMSEVGQKAMSSAINDVGSGISALNALTRILIDSRPDPEATRCDCPHLSIECFDLQDLIYGSFMPLARDCAQNLELNQRLLKCLSMIEQNVPEPELRQAATQMAMQVLQRCLHHFDFAPERALIQADFAALFSTSATA